MNHIIYKTYKYGVDVPIQTLDKGITMKIIFKNKDNSIGIITPTNEALSFATVYQIAEKDTPQDLPYWIVEDSVIPENRTFRSAWEIDESFGEPDGFGGESNQFDEALLKAYNERNGE